MPDRRGEKSFTFASIEAADAGKSGAERSGGAREAYIQVNIDPSRMANRMGSGFYQYLASLCGKQNRNGS